MRVCSRVASVAFVLVLGLAGAAMAQDRDAAQRDPKPAADREKSDTTPPEKPAAEKDKDKEKEKAGTPAASTRSRTEKATFGAGCFWSNEAVFERVGGVKSVVSGFAGGTVPNPSYQLVCAGWTGHAEVVQVEFDPDVVSYDMLLKIFFLSHDPTTLNSQGDDFGTQYRSVVFYHSEEQKQAAQKMYRTLTAHKTFHAPIVTELVPFKAFYPAETYHQDYYRKNRNSEYSQIYIIPKLRKLKAKLK